METKQEENICKNCKHFSQHFIKRIINFNEVNCGHCKFSFRYNFRSYKKPSDAACIHWESNKTKLEEKSRSLKNAIFSMQKDLHSIALVLQDDNDI